MDMMEFKRTFKDENGKPCFYPMEPTQFMMRTWKYRPAVLFGPFCLKTETHFLIYPVQFGHFLPLCWN